MNQTQLEVFMHLIIVYSILTNVIFVSPFPHRLALLPVGQIKNNRFPGCHYYYGPISSTFPFYDNHRTKLFSHRRPPPLPDINIGLSDEEFHKWLYGELEHVPGRVEYSDIYDMSIDAIVKWRKRFRGNPKLWKRIFKKDRVLKELVEATPIIRSVLTYLQSMDMDMNMDTDDRDKNENEVRRDYEKVTIIDLCSGKGYLSMFLSELLPPEKVEKIILVDKAWAMCGTKDLKPSHINWEHIYGTIPTKDIFDGCEGQHSSVDHDLSPSSKETYFTTWPIRLHTSKQDLKQSCNQRQMKKHFFDKIQGPVVILAIHLCGTLSLKAVDMFNNNDNVSLFALKPCCLPQMIHAQRGDIFKIGKHEFKAEDVCSNGRFNKKEWTGPPRWHLEGTFNKWADNLYRGIDLVDCELNGYEDSSVSRDGKKKKQNIAVQIDGGFQNTYILAQRPPLTSKLWVV